MGPIWGVIFRQIGFPVSEEGEIGLIRARFPRVNTSVAVFGVRPGNAAELPDAAPSRAAVSYRGGGTDLRPKIGSVPSMVQLIQTWVSVTRPQAREACPHPTCHDSATHATPTVHESATPNQAAMDVCQDY